MNTFRLLIFTICILIVGMAPEKATSQVVINEICSYNGSILQDEDESEPDWIELFNSGSSPVNLEGYSLKTATPDLWFFPSVVVQPQEYIVVFASAKNKISPNLHTNFKISKEGESIHLINPNGVQIDALEIPALHLDHSFGRKPDGVIGTEGIFSLPTPGTSNQIAVQYAGYVSPPEFSMLAGLYNGASILEISADAQVNIYFTTNGSVPNNNSAIYTGPININSTSVIRAICYSNNSSLLPSSIISNTYILNYNQTLPVFSISTNPDDLWDWDTGIYMTGPNASPNYPYYGANYWQDREIEAHIEFFEDDGTRKISQDAGISIHGGTSNRTKAMKSLRLANKNKFGYDSFQHQFFDDKPINEFKNLVLRNSSGDFNKTHFRDGSLHKLMIGKTNIDLTAYRPCVVFLNGIYFGIHNIREKISKYYVKENFGINEDNIDLLEEDTMILEGDFTAFNAMHAFVTGNNMAQPENFKAAASMIDTESLCDYYIAETFLSNIDWPYNNIKFWKEKKQDARWRYLLIDLDIALGNNGWAPVDFDILGRIMGGYGDTNRHVQIYRSLLQNKDFKTYFINRYADLVNTIFKAEYMAKHIESTRNMLVEEMPLHFGVWGNTMQGWDNEIYNVVMPHIYGRPEFAMKQVKDVFNLSNIINVELDVWPPEAGTIHINTITPTPLPWSGNYFDGNPVTIRVMPNPGFSFVRWVSNNEPLNFPGNPELRVNVEVNSKFTAYFSTTNDISTLMIYPNPSDGKINVGCVMNHAGEGNIEIFNAIGAKVMVISNLQITGGVNKMELDLTTLASGIYTLHFVTDEGLKSGRINLM